MLKTPEFDSARLVFVAPQEADFSRYAEIWADPEVTRYIDGAPRSRAKCREAWDFNLAHWGKRGFGNWLLREIGSGTIIGQVGFFEKARGLGPDFDGTVESGWVLAPEVFGCGYGSEAVLAAHGWWDRQAFAAQTVCMLNPGNIGSEKIARKAGYVPMRSTEFDRTPVVLMRRAAPKL